VSARRHISLALPERDPHTAIIRQWLAAQPQGSDLSKLLRQIIVQGLQIGAALNRIEARLEQLTALGVVGSLPAPPAVLPPADSAVLDTQFWGQLLASCSVYGFRKRRRSDPVTVRWGLQNALSR
jgi:hypothetical protein